MSVIPSAISSFLPLETNVAKRNTTNVRESALTAKRENVAVIG